MDTGPNSCNFAQLVSNGDQLLILEITHERFFYHTKWRYH